MIERKPIEERTLEELGWTFGWIVAAEVLCFLFGLLFGALIFG